MKYLLAAAAFAAAPVAAQQPGPAAAPAAPAAPAAAPVDPQRLAVAAQVAEQTFPDGTFRRLMGEGMDLLIGSAGGGIYDTEMKDIVPLEGEEADPDLAGKTMREIIVKEDPHFFERMEITNRVTMAEILPVMTRFEPRIRGALAQAYARRFTTAQLNDIRTFFASPSGKAYAAEAMTLGADQEFMKAVTSFGPELMKEMPAITRKIAEATAHLPPPPPRPDLTPVHREPDDEQPKRSKGRR